MHLHRLLFPVALLTLVGCSSLRYELDELPFPVSASPPAGGLASG